MCLNLNLSRKLLLMIRFVLAIFLIALVSFSSFGQYETELIKRLPHGSPNEDLFSSNNKLYFLGKDDTGENAVFTVDLNSEEAVFYYKHETINANAAITILFVDDDYMYFSGRKLNELDNQSYLHRVKHTSGVVELLTDEVRYDSTGDRQVAVIGSKIIFRGKTFDSQPLKYYYSLDLETALLTPLILVDNTYDYISMARTHVDGLMYINLRLANGNDYHDFVTDGTLEGTNRFLDPSSSVGASSIFFTHSIGDAIYFQYKWNGQFLGTYRSKGYGHPIEPFVITPPANYMEYITFDAKDKFLMHYTMSGDMHLRYGEVNMTTGEYSHCFTYDNYFIEDDYTGVQTAPFANRSLLIRNFNISKHQGFIEDCSLEQPFELPFNVGDPFEMVDYYSSKESGGVLYISGIFKLQNEQQNQHAIIRVKPTDLSVKEVDENLISLFPNPANDQLTIMSDDQTEISIFNTTGKLIYTSTIGIGENQIDVSSFQAGMYLVTLSNGKNGKFLKH